MTVVDVKIVNDFMQYLLIKQCQFLHCFIIFFSFYSLYAEVSINPNERLEIFFHYLINEEMAGYVLFGEKPLFMQGVQDPIYSLPNTPLHKKQVIYKEGIRLWKQINQNMLSPDYFFIFEELSSQKTPHWKHFYLVNRLALNDVLKKEAILFEKSLHESPFTLYQTIIDPQICTLDFMENNTVLMGVLLGYGKKNAIKEKRIEEMKDFLNQTCPPPFIKGNFLSLLKEKLTKINQQIHHTMEISSKNLRTQMPIFFFAVFDKGKETLRLLHSYEKTQKKLQLILNSSDFLSIVLDRLLCEKIENFLFFDPSSSEKIPTLVAKELLGILDEILCIQKEEFPLILQTIKNGIRDAYSGKKFPVGNSLQDLIAKKCFLEERTDILSLANRKLLRKPREWQLVESIRTKIAYTLSYDLSNHWKSLESLSKENLICEITLIIDQPKTEWIIDPKDKDFLNLFHFEAYHSKESSFHQ
jgi:hypothetical protein